MAGRATARAASKRKRRAPRISRRRLRLLWAAAILTAAAYLYYQPISSYLETRGDLEARRAEVSTLRQARDELRLRLVDSKSLESTQREARRIGYVMPGERLFVVKGIPAWRQARSASRDERTP